MTKWARTNKKNYESLGYTFTNYGDEFEVNVRHLPMQSSIDVDVKCDFCDAEFKRSYVKYRQRNGYDACNSCRLEKSKKESKFGRKYDIH